MGLFLSPDATINGKPILGAPNIVISGVEGGTASPVGFEQIGLTRREGRNDVPGPLTDIVSYTMGKHQFRFGAEVRQARVNEFYHRRGTGKFTFDGTRGPWDSTTGCKPSSGPAPAGCALIGKPGDVDATFALAAYLAGDVAGSTIAVGNPERFVTVNAFNLYFQDAWQLTQKLNLNLGLRYEYFGPLHSDRKDIAVFVPGKGLLIQGAGIDSIFPANKNDFAPRLGFAYQPTGTGDLVVRGGIGIFFDQINMNPFMDFRPPIGAEKGMQGNPIGPSPVSTYGTNLLGQTSYTWQNNQQIFKGVTTCPDPLCTGTPGFNLFGVSQNFRTPHFANYNLQMEKGFGKAAVLQVGYVGSEGRKLNIVTNINKNGTFNTDPLHQYGSILQLNSVGTSNYNALQTTFRVRSWHGLTSQFGYTWSHALDEISEYRAVIADDPNNIKKDYGNGDYDTRHLFTTSFTYDVPGSSHGPKFLTHGWQISSLWNFHSGQPYDVTLKDALGLNLIGDPFKGISHSFSKNLASCSCPGVRWVNLAAYGACRPNIGRNKFHGPRYGDSDLSIFN